jgi:hypothetical protein
MRLVDLVSQETGADFAQIMLLRHSTDAVDKLDACGGSVEEWTSIQPPGSKYDYWADGKPQIHVVVVIVRDRVYGVYRVLGVEAEGTRYSLASKALRQSYIERGREDGPARRFTIERIPCTAVDAQITGWKGKEINPVSRCHVKLFWEIEVNLDRAPINVEARDLTDAEIEAAIRDGDLRFPTIVATSSPEAIARQRRGQDVLRKLTLQNYEARCAICDVSDVKLLRASHIVGWAEREETRGNLGNVICLCSFHDVLFENGYWSLDDRLGMVIRTDIDSNTIRGLFPAGCSFRKPSTHSPGVDFIRHHRRKHGLPCSL